MSSKTNMFWHLGIAASILQHGELTWILYYSLSFMRTFDCISCFHLTACCLLTSGFVIVMSVVLIIFCMEMATLLKDIHV